MSAAYDEAVKAQRDAADPGASVFVTANAGSGKTKVLVDRIVRLLLDNVAPSAFLCITFTKAAAAEMQRRLFDRLGAWCVMDDAALSEQLAGLGEPAPDAERLATARALFARALETPGGLRIQTIHGFCERLIARFPLEAGVPPGFEIAEEARAAALAEIAWRQIAGDRRLDGALERLAARFNPDAFTLLRGALASQRAALAEVVQAHGGVDAASAAIIARHREAEAPERIAADALARVDWDFYRELEGVLRGGSKSDVSLANTVAAARAAQDFDSALGIFLTQDGKVRATFGTQALRQKHAALFAEAEALRDDLLVAQGRINAAARARDAAAALALGHALADAYARARHAVGALDFEDLIEKALGLLQDSDAAPWVLYKLDGGIAHILIDEGQDTSPAQWRLIAPLQAEFFAGEGAHAAPRTVFAVGDPKQSIYSFQGADPERFDDEAQALEARTRDAGRTFVAPELRMSFRSTPEVLKAVDATFAGLPMMRKARSGDVLTHFPHRDQHVGRVEWWPLTPKPKKTDEKPWDAPLDNDRERTAAAVLCAALAKRARGWIDAGEAVWDEHTRTERPMRPGDILCLVRSRGAMFQQLLKAMKRVGLPVAGADRMVLKDEIAVLDLLAAARVALNPADDLSLATLLKSPWIGLVDDDADIFPLAHGRVKDERLIARLRASDDPKYAAAKAWVEDLVAHAHVHPHVFFARILERATDGVSGWEQMVARLGHQARDPAEELLARALAAGRQGPATLQHFIHRIEGDAAQIKRETAQGEDAVRVMTVHGAKGLEAAVVLLADTTGAVLSGATGGLHMTPAGPVVPGPAGANDPATEAAIAAADDAALLEHRRLLYVAMTRARDRLIVCGPQWGTGKEGAAAESWWGAVREGMARAGAGPCETPFGEGLAFGETKVLGAAGSATLAAPMLPGWARTRAPLEGMAREAVSPSRLGAGEGPVLSPRIDGRSRFRRGALIHGLLQRLPDVPPDRRETAAQAWLRARRVGEAEATALIGEVLRVLDDARFGAVFGPGSRAEAPIVATLEDGTVVRGSIDRMVVGPKAVLLLDFKTDRPPPATSADVPARILAQMAAYRAACRRIFPDRPVHAALLWTDGPALMDLPDRLLDAVPPADARR